MITLVAILCHSLTQLAIPTCVDEVVPTEFTMMAGKSSEPVPMVFTATLCKMTGERIIVEWMVHHPVYRTWELRAFECVPGEYNSSKRA